MHAVNNGVFMAIHRKRVKYKIQTNTIFSHPRVRQKPDNDKNKTTRHVSAAGGYRGKIIRYRGFRYHLLN